MVKNRLIAVLIINNGQVVQSIKFKHTNVIHWDPVEAVDIFNEWAIDEIIALNVSKDKKNKEEFISIINDLSKKCFVPLTAGGWIEDLDDARNLIKNGADKIVINTMAYKNINLIYEISQIFGKQCVVVSIDSKVVNDKRVVCIDRGRENTDTTPLEWAKKVIDFGAGELFINSIDHDGNREGYDLELIKEISSEVNVPVIAFGGVFTWNHLVDGIEISKADAVAAANILHYTEHSSRKAKKFLIKNNLNFRKI